MGGGFSANDTDCACDSTRLHKDKVHLKLTKMTNFKCNSHYQH